MFRVKPLQEADLQAFRGFLGHIRKEHWVLSSSAFAEAPESPPSPSRNHGETLVLTDQDQIISCLCLSRISNVAILSNAETLPEYQRRGTFWRFLGIPIIRQLCECGDFDRIEATTWTFNRKGIPVYKRFGFRAVPDTSLHMVNYLPTILRHPDAATYFEKVDYIRYLQNRRSYGYDAIEENGRSVFEHRWKSREGEELRVLVDWRTHEVVKVDVE